MTTARDPRSTSLTSNQTGQHADSSGRVRVWREFLRAARDGGGFPYGVGWPVAFSHAKQLQNHLGPHWAALKVTRAQPTNFVHLQESLRDVRQYTHALLDRLASNAAADASRQPRSAAMAELWNLSDGELVHLACIVDTLVLDGYAFVERDQWGRRLSDWTLSTAEESVRYSAMRWMVSTNVFAPTDNVVARHWHRVHPFDSSAFTAWFVDYETQFEQARAFSSKGLVEFAERRRKRGKPTVSPRETVTGGLTEGTAGHEPEQYVSARAVQSNVDRANTYSLVRHWLCNHRWPQQLECLFSEEVLYGHGSGAHQDYGPYKRASAVRALKGAVAFLREWYRVCVIESIQHMRAMLTRVFRLNSSDDASALRPATGILSPWTTAYLDGLEARLRSSGFTDTDLHLDDARDMLDDLRLVRNTPAFASASPSTTGDSHSPGFPSPRTELATSLQSMVVSESRIAALSSGARIVGSATGTGAGVPTLDEVLQRASTELHDSGWLGVPMSAFRPQPDPPAHADEWGDATWAEMSEESDAMAGVEEARGADTQAPQGGAPSTGPVLQQRHIASSSSSGSEDDSLVASPRPPARTTTRVSSPTPRARRARSPADAALSPPTSPRRSERIATRAASPPAQPQPRSPVVGEEEAGAAAASPPTSPRRSDRLAAARAASPPTQQQTLPVPPPTQQQTFPASPQPGATRPTQEREQEQEPVPVPVPASEPRPQSVVPAKRFADSPRRSGRIARLTQPVPAAQGAVTQTTARKATRAEAAPQGAASAATRGKGKRKGKQPARAKRVHWASDLGDTTTSAHASSSDSSSTSTSSSSSSESSDSDEDSVYDNDDVEEAAQSSEDLGDDDEEASHSSSDVSDSSGGEHPQHTQSKSVGDESAESFDERTRSLDTMTTASATEAERERRGAAAVGQPSAPAASDAAASHLARSSPPPVLLGHDASMDDIPSPSVAPTAVAPIDTVYTASLDATAEVTEQAALATDAGDVRADAALLDESGDLVDDDETDAVIQGLRSVRDATTAVAAQISAVAVDMDDDIGDGDAPEQETDGDADVVDADQATQPVVEPPSRATSASDSSDDDTGSDSSPDSGPDTRSFTLTVAPTQRVVTVTAEPEQRRATPPASQVVAVVESVASRDEAPPTEAIAQAAVVPTVGSRDEFGTIAAVDPDGTVYYETISQETRAIHAKLFRLRHQASDDVVVVERSEISEPTGQSARRAPPPVAPIEIASQDTDEFRRASQRQFEALFAQPVKQEGAASRASVASASSDDDDDDW